MPEQFLEYWLLVIVFISLYAGFFVWTMTTANRRYKKLLSLSHKDTWKRKRETIENQESKIASGNGKPRQDSGFHSRLTSTNIPVTRLVNNPMRQRSYARKRMYRMKVRLIHCPIR